MPPPPDTARSAAAAKGLRDIKTTRRNGRVIGIVRVDDDDEMLMMTARGKIQRVAVGEISVIGRNTQGVRIMRLDEEDVLAAVVRVPTRTSPKRTWRMATSTPLPPGGGLAIERPPAVEMLDDESDVPKDETDAGEE